MRPYRRQHPYYCGVDLHARSLFVNVLDDTGKTRLAIDLPASPRAFLDAVKPYREGLVVGCEYMFAWYWLADLCEREAIPFVLGHALAMKAIHGGKAKNDRLDAEKIAGLLKGGFFPMAYVYPKDKRETRDLLRRRSFFVRQRAQSIAHIQNTNSRYNLPPFDKKLTYKGNRSADIAKRFEHPSTQPSIASDLQLIDSYDTQIAALELHLVKSAKVDDPSTFAFLRTIPGIGPILGLVMLYEIDAIKPLPGGGQLPVVLAAGGLHARERGQGQGSGRTQDRQCPFEVGLLRSRIADAAELPGGEVVDAASVEEAWQEESPRDPRGEDRQDGLSLVA